MVEKICETCGTEFRVSPCRAKTAKFCSVDCRAQAKAGRPNGRSHRVKKQCETCQTTFYVSPYRANTARFCSRSCTATWVCSLPHNRGPKPWMTGNNLRAGLKPTNAFTPEQVRGANNPRWVESAEFKCEHCGGLFALKPWRVRTTTRVRFCSRQCFEQAGCFRGELSSTYVGGPTTVRGENWRSIRADVIRLQDGACADCGRIMGISLHVHHKIPFREFKTAAEANVRSNLIGLCPRCHIRADRAADRALRAAREPDQTSRRSHQEQLDPL